MDRDDDQVESGTLKTTAPVLESAGAMNVVPSGSVTSIALLRAVGPGEGHHAVAVGKRHVETEVRWVRRDGRHRVRIWRRGSTSHTPCGAVDGVRRGRAAGTSRRRRSRQRPPKCHPQPRCWPALGGVSPCRPPSCQVRRRTRRRQGDVARHRIGRASRLKMHRTCQRPSFLLETTGTVSASLTPASGIPSTAASAAEPSER